MLELAHHEGKRVSECQGDWDILGPMICMDKKIYIYNIYLSHLMNEIPCNHHISHSDATGSCETCSTFESPVFQNTTSSFCRDAVANMS